MIKFVRILIILLRGIRSAFANCDIAILTSDSYTCSCVSAGRIRSVPFWDRKPMFRQVWIPGRTPGIARGRRGLVARPRDPRRRRLSRTHASRDARHRVDCWRSVRSVCPPSAELIKLINGVKEYDLPITLTSLDRQIVRSLKALNLMHFIPVVTRVTRIDGATISGTLSCQSQGFPSALETL